MEVLIIIMRKHFFFFASVWIHDNFILSQNKVFRVNDAKMRPRLNLYNADLKHHCPNMTERLIRCQTACMENTVFIHMYSKLIIILVTSIIAALSQLSRLPFPGEPSSQETAQGMLPDLPLSVCVLVDFAWMVWYLFLYHHLGKVGCKIWCGALYLHSTPS